MSAKHRLCDPPSPGNRTLGVTDLRLQLLRLALVRCDVLAQLVDGLLRAVRLVLRAR